MRVVGLSEMKQLETRAFEEYGLTSSLMTEHIGVRGSDFIEDSFLEDNSYGELVFLIGPGNNGADGLSIARHLHNRGYNARAFILFPDESGPEELQVQINLAKNFGVKLSKVRKIEELEAYLTQTQDEYLVVDGILGLGFRAPLSNYLFEVINLVNIYASITIAVDIASGIIADNGAISSSAIRADYTLAIGLPKVGHFTSDGAAYSGDVLTLETGLPSELLEGGNKALLTTENVLNLFKGRDKFAHKNKFGHTLVVGGSQGLTGALIMASTSALKVGTGLVTAATWDESYPELASRVQAEIMIGRIPDTSEGDQVEKVARFLERYDSVIIGPGLGRKEKTRELVLGLLNNFPGPVVVDADAIRVLNFKEDQEVFLRRKAPTILTPHMGEFAHFAGVRIEDVQKRPIDYLKQIVDETNCCWVLKDACSYLGFPSGEIFINYFPNDGMATGGSGDVLAGILGGLLAQNSGDRKQSSFFADKSRFYKALCLGVTVHSLAGKHSAEKLGVRAMTAGSIIEHLPDAFFELKSLTEPA